MEKERTPVRLLKKGTAGLKNLLFSRMTLCLLFLALQILILFAGLLRFGAFLPHIVGGQFLLTCGMVLYLFNSKLDATAKLTWLVLIMVAPVFGSLLYLFSIRELGHRAMKKRVGEIAAQSSTALTQPADTQEALAAACPGAAALARYVRSSGGYPIYQNTEVRYFPSGEAKLARLLEALEQAKEFIFLEYFIIEEGLMWGQILEVLIRKAAQGVDVRVMYDGTCEFMLLPKGYSKKLAAHGIRCKVFSPVIPLVSTHYNYRDHRKILVIDGHTAFTGGINLADEYINAKPKFGHWKDTAVMLRGEAAQNLTLLFLQNWCLDEKTPDFTGYLRSQPVAAPGFVMPYGDNPLDGQRVGRQVYIDILNRAQKYVMIMTPYLILDGETENALRYAAARGVEVKLILPGIPDKAIPYALAKTHYPALLDAGVEIYEYTPGFVHAKVFLSDDREAVVGTINLDYRSLHHHFECAAYLLDCPCLRQIREDFDATLAQCRRVDAAALKQEPRLRRIMGRIAKLFAPLL